jgi:hypothetical protein
MTRYLVLQRYHQASLPPEAASRAHESKYLSHVKTAGGEGGLHAGFPYRLAFCSDDSSPAENRHDHRNPAP